MFETIKRLFKMLDMMQGRRVNKVTKLFPIDLVNITMKIDIFHVKLSNCSVANDGNRGSKPIVYALIGLRVS